MRFLQYLYCFQSLFLWCISLFLIACFISSLIQSGCLSCFTRLDFTGTCLSKTNINEECQRAKFIFVLFGEKVRVDIFSDKSDRKESSL